MRAISRPLARDPEKARDTEISLMLQNYLAIGIVNIMATAVLSYMVHHNDLLDMKVRRHFLVALLCVGLVIAAELGTTFTAYPDAAAVMAQTVFNIIGFSLSPFVPIAIGTAFGDPLIRRKYLFLIPAMINLVFAALSPAFGFIFSVLPDGSYFRGPWFFIFILAYAAGMLYLFIQTMYVTRVYQNRNQTTLYWLYLFLLSGTTVQLLLPSIHTAWTSVSLAMIMYYAYTCDLVEKHDVLTNLLNRRSYERRLPVLRANGSATIFILDVDDLKATNDRYGHPYGDECLRAIAGNMKDSFGRIGLCYRIGGDEFSVLSRITDNSALRSAEELFKAKMEASRKQDPNLPFVSFGRALYDQTQTGIEQAVAEADRRMFINKQTQKLARMRG